MKKSTNRKNQLGCLLTITAAIMTGAIADSRPVMAQAQAPSAHVSPASFHQSAACDCGSCNVPVHNACGCGTCQNSCQQCSSQSYLLDGWLTQGFTLNPASPPDGFNTPVTFNDGANDYQLNQLYFQLGKSFQIGRWHVNARADVLYGTDYFFVTSTGLELHQDGTPRWNSEDGPRENGAATYGLALPQAYVDISPCGCNSTSFKIGHFYTTLGYESVEDPLNKFYSRSYATQYAQPFTHTGALIQHRFSPQFVFVGGITRGWDNWEDPNGDLGFLGSVLLETRFGSTISFGIHTGNEDLLGDNNRTAYSLVYEQPLSRSATWVIQHNYGTEEDAAIDAAGQSDDASWYGVVNYLLFNTSQSTTWGLRAEWFRDADNARVVAIPLAAQVDGSDYVGITLSRNQRISTYMNWRMEARWDWSDVEPLGQPGIFDTFEDDNQFLLSTSVTIDF